MRSSTDKRAESRPSPGEVRGGDGESVVRSRVTRVQAYAKAEQSMRRGKRLVIGGFAVAVIGIVGYCVACIGAGLSQDVGAYFLGNPALLVGPALATIGLGTLLWLVGSFFYLTGAMDSDPDGPELYF
ncbi:hypothetical protein L6R50_07715 [Myxococcota bacterium]|nr:hypothetical protein [Myxococcota bacterium]